MDTLKPLLEELVKMIREGYDFGKEQIPDIGKQILRYYFWVNVLQVAVNSIVSAGLLRWGYTFYAISMEAKYERDANWMAVILIGSLIIASLTFLYFGICALLQVKIAPKLFLLDTLASYFNREESQ